MTKKSLLLATALVPLGAAITFAELTPPAPADAPSKERILEILDVPTPPQSMDLKLAHNTNDEKDEDDDGSQESDDDDDGSQESDDDDDGSQESDDDDDGSQEADDD